MIRTVLLVMIFAMTSIGFAEDESSNHARCFYVMSSEFKCLVAIGHDGSPQYLAGTMKGHSLFFPDFKENGLHLTIQIGDDGNSRCQLGLTSFGTSLAFMEAGDLLDLNEIRDGVRKTLDGESYVAVFHIKDVRVLPQEFESYESFGRGNLLELAERGEAYFMREIDGAQ